MIVDLAYSGCLRPMNTSYRKFFDNGQGWGKYGIHACISSQFHMKVTGSHSCTNGYKINRIVS